MTTLKEALLTLQGHLAAGRITQKEYDQAVRERAGRTITQYGTLRAKKKSQPTAFDSGMPASLGVQRSMSRSCKVDSGKPAPEVQVRDMKIAYDRDRVAMGCNSVLTKVVKGGGLEYLKARGKLTATVGEIVGQSTGG